MVRLVARAVAIGAVLLTLGVANVPTACANAQTSPQTSAESSGSNGEGFSLPEWVLWLVMFGFALFVIFGNSPGTRCPKCRRTGAMKQTGRKYRRITPPFEAEPVEELRCVHCGHRLHQAQERDQ